jgi:hypothetical protein
LNEVAEHCLADEAHDDESTSDDGKRCRNSVSKKGRHARRGWRDWLARERDHRDHRRARAVTVMSFCWNVTRHPFTSRKPRVLPNTASERVPKQQYRSDNQTDDEQVHAKLKGYRDKTSQPFTRFRPFDRGGR